MTKEEYYKLEINNIVFRKSDSKIVILNTCFSSDKIPTENDSLWVNDSFGGANSYGVSIAVKDIDDWVLVRSLNDFTGFPHAHANFALMQIDELKNKLRNTTIF